MTDFSKIIRLDDYFPTGELTLQPALMWSRGRPVTRGLTKTASLATDYIQNNVQPIPGKSIILVIALGGWETYGVNRNGDGFNEFPYKETAPPTCNCSSCQGQRGWVAPDQTVVAHNNTFEDFARVYKHHVNKDPAKSYGDVLKAFWNPEMHRSELLLGIDHDKAPDLVERLEAGEFFPVSMGCKIKYDVCTICGHRAPTRAQYCDHLKYNMRQVLPDGRQVGALNPAPKFFDISIVYRPADQTGWTIKKVAEEGPAYSGAELGDYVSAWDSKKSNLRKLSEIDKVVSGVAVDADNEEAQREIDDLQKLKGALQPTVDSGQFEALPDEVIAKLAQLPLAESVTALNQMGILLTTPEFIKLVVEKSAPGATVDDSLIESLLSAQSELFQTLAEHPQLEVQCEEAITPSGPVDTAKVAAILGPWREKRAATGDYLLRTLVPPAARYTEPPYTDMMTIHDPSTGREYITTRGAAIAAHDEYAKRNLARQAATAGLISSAQLSRALGGSGEIPLEMARLVVPDQGPQMMTEEGFVIPQLTEVVEKTSSHGPIPVMLSLMKGYRDYPVRRSVKLASFLNSLREEEKLAAVDSVHVKKLNLPILIDKLSQALLG